MSRMKRPRRVGIFDAGIGGFPVAAELLRRDPELELVYLGDAARRPYGPREVSQVADFTREAERFLADAGCDAWVVACYTASVALASVPGSSVLPRVDMIRAAQRALDPAAQNGRRVAVNGATAVMATAATVSSGVLPRLLPVPVAQQIPTERLLRLAETDGGTDPDQLRVEIWAALNELLPEVTSVLLACTDFTCIGTQLVDAAPHLRFVDPIDVAADLVVDLLDRSERHGVPTAGGRALPDHERVGEHWLYLTGPHEADVLAAARRYALPFDHVRLTQIAAEQREGTS